MQMLEDRMMATIIIAALALVGMISYWLGWHCAEQAIVRQAQQSGSVMVRGQILRLPHQRIVERPMAMRECSTRCAITSDS
jgi:hypothetical protein